jgi:hypothetical protein
VRYFLDTEFNGFGGALLSLALVPDDGGEELYLTLACPDPLNDWVERHVAPYLDSVPEHLVSRRLARGEAAAVLSEWLIREHDTQSAVRYPQPVDSLEIVADWPEDIAQFSMLLTTGPGRMMPVPPLRFDLIPLPGFSTAANSAVPHNALHDARALRDHLSGLEM